MKKLSRDDVLEIIRAAREDGRVPDLSGADLTGVDLSEVDLSGVNLYRADLSGADLYGANLHGADLYGANLTGANLTQTNLTGTNLHEARWDGLAVDGLHPYRCILVPLPGLWLMRIGCWFGTVQDLRDLIAGDDWPESRGEEMERLRPLLAVWADMCDAHIASRPDVIDDLAQRWAQ